MSSKYQDTVNVTPHLYTAGAADEACVRQELEELFPASRLNHKHKKYAAY